MVFPIVYSKTQKSIDNSANLLVLLVDKYRHFVRFRESDAACARCGRKLEVYYCENRTFAVRCMDCGTLTLVQASSPAQAAAKVGRVPELMEVEKE